MGNDSKGPLEALRGALQGRWDETRSRRALDAALAQAARTRLARRIALAGAMAGALACVGWAAIDRGRPSFIANVPINEAAQRLVWFEDGSHATLLAEHTSLFVPQQNDSVQKVELKLGSARFDVMPRKSRTFRVVAGPATIEVLGTSFVVERLGPSTRVTVIEGLVRVTDAVDAIVLGATDSMTFPRSHPTLHAVPNPTPAAATSDEAPSPHPTPEVHAKPLTRAPAKQVGSGTRDGQHQDTRAMADALFAADAARLRGDYDEAARRLTTFLERNANDPRAGAAAFTLGRIHMDDRRSPKDAAIAFERALRLGTGRVLETDALARAAFAWEQAGNIVRAVRRAQDYLAKAPAGDHAAAMRTIVAKQTRE